MIAMMITAAIMSPSFLGFFRFRAFSCLWYGGISRIFLFFQAGNGLKNKGNKSFPIYTTPWAIMASTTFSKPAILAPAT